jgi:hypothetical protein
MQRGVRWNVYAAFEKENDLWSRGPVLSRVATYEKPETPCARRLVYAFR